MKRKERGRSTRDIEGLYLADISPGEILLIRTLNSRYTVTYLGFGAARIVGNPDVCQHPQLVNILGSTWGGSALLAGFLGIGMCLQFALEGDSRVTTTSPIQALIRVGREQEATAAFAPAGVRAEGRYAHA